MIAYHGDEKIKRKYVERMRAHMAADELVRGKGWDGHKGCAVGCTFNQYSHAAAESKIGVPEVLMRLEDSIFEGLPVADAMKFPLEFLKAIRPGADLSLVWPQFSLWMLADPDDGVLQFADAVTRPAIEGVAELFFLTVAGEIISQEQWQKAYANAYANAYAAAYANAAAASDYANSHADAYAYADGYAYADARIKQRDMLLRLLREA